LVFLRIMYLPLVCCVLSLINGVQCTYSLTSGLFWVPPAMVCYILYSMNTFSS
jgi:hypothetical protein